MSNEHVLNMRRYLFMLLTISFCVGFVGVTGAYLAGSRVFNYRFGMLEGTTIAATGYLIEVLRLVVALGCTTLGLIPGFRRHILKFFGSYQSSSQIRRLHVVALAVYLVLGTGFAAYQVSECLSFSQGSYPETVMQWGWKHGVIEHADYIQESHATARAYRFYSLYSVVFYGMIVPILAVLPMAAVFEDANFIYRYYGLIERSSPRFLEQRVRRFRNFLSLGGGKYVDLLGAIAVFHMFEVLVGNLTLSESGRSAAAVGAGLCVVSAVILFVVWISYYSARVIASERLPALDLSERGIGSASVMVREMVRRRFGGYAILAAFIVSAPLQALLKSVSEVM